MGIELGIYDARRRTCFALVPKVPSDRYNSAQGHSSKRATIPVSAVAKNSCWKLKQELPLRPADAQD
jgi:hypothetical protein